MYVLFCHSKLIYKIIHIVLGMFTFIGIEIFIAFIGYYIFYAIYGPLCSENLFCV